MAHVTCTVEVSTAASRLHHWPLEPQGAAMSEGSLGTEGPEEGRASTHRGPPRAGHPSWRLSATARLRGLQGLGAECSSAAHWSAQGGDEAVTLWSPHAGKGTWGQGHGDRDTLGSPLKAARPPSQPSWVVSRNSGRGQEAPSEGHPSRDQAAPPQLAPDAHTPWFPLQKQWEAAEAGPSSWYQGGGRSSYCSFVRWRN